MQPTKYLTYPGASNLIIEAYSFDFDGCFANYDFLSTDEKTRCIIKSNIDLINYINKSKNPKIVFIGSNRQSLLDDRANSASDNRGSCYPALLEVSRQINAKFNSFLMADLYNDLKDGTTLKQALKYISKKTSLYNEKKVSKALSRFPNWVHDESKMTLIYAQMHKLAIDHPNDQIQFHFIDDKEELLNDLYEYFSKFPELIPKNVTLNLKAYTGPTDRNGKPVAQLFKAYNPIPGTRELPDHDFRNTVKNMAAVAIEGEPYITSQYSHTSITRYSEAKKYHLDLSAIKVLKYYQPGMIPKFPAVETAQTKKKMEAPSSIETTRFSLFQEERFKSNKSSSNNSIKESILENNTSLEPLGKNSDLPQSSGGWIYGIFNYSKTKVVNQTKEKCEIPKTLIPDHS
jgi:hypothetical protein